MRGITIKYRCTQLGAELIQHRRPFEKHLYSWSLLAQYFLHQVTTHRAIRIVAKSFKKRRTVRGNAQRERRQAQHCNPALRQFLERTCGFVCRNASQYACEKGFRLLECKTQVDVTHFI